MSRADCMTREPASAQDRMRSIEIPAQFTEFAVPADSGADATVVVPTVMGSWALRYGRHGYYFMNFRTGRGLRVCIPHREIIRPGLDRFKEAVSRDAGSSSRFRWLRRSYHYGFNVLEQVMLLTIPHTVTDVGDGRFIINLWAYYGYLLVDCSERSVTYFLTEESEDDHLLGSKQVFDPREGELTTLSFSLQDSLARIKDSHRPVESRLFRHRIGAAGSDTIWQGEMADYLHDLVISKGRRYAAICELGMYLDTNGETLPSRVKIIDLETGREWALDRFKVAAHAQFDPHDPDVIYFSSHNFQFRHSGILELLRKANYAVDFRGAASVHKVRLTPNGPCEIGVFTRPDFHRLTNMHIFVHRGRKLLAATGFPDTIFLVDPESMDTIGTIRVRDPGASGQNGSRQSATVGTISPSPDGEMLFTQTTKSFQVIRIATGEPEHANRLFFNHTCANHMLTTANTDW